MSQVTLGELLTLLKFRDEKQEVRFDFVYFRPDGIDSYRGYYDQLAVGYSAEGTVIVADFRRQLSACIGKVFTGYKGGDYTMGEHTPLWVANYGEAGSTAIAGIEDCSYYTILKTAWND